MSPRILCAVEGFVFNLGLLLAVGAQASFILRHGLARRHVAPVVAICFLCDLMLIGVGTLGVGTVAGDGLAGRLLALSGAAFMIAYGARALLAAWRSARPGPDPMAAPGYSLAAAVLATLAVTLLNPHVYIDAFVLLGAAAGQYPPSDRPWFALGAVAASLAWFTALGHGATLFAGVLRHRAIRTALDVLVGALMWRAAALLLAGL